MVPFTETGDTGGVLQFISWIKINQQLYPWSPLTHRLWMPVRKGWSWTCLLLLSRFSRVQLCATPQTAAHQALLSLGFSRQEHWSGLPFPSPVHESEKWKWSHSVMSNSSRPHGLQPTRLLRPWDFPGKSTGVGCHCLLWEHAYWSSKKRVGPDGIENLL